MKIGQLLGDLIDDVHSVLNFARVHHPPRDVIGLRYALHDGVVFQWITNSVVANFILGDVWVVDTNDGYSRAIIEVCDDLPVEPWHWKLSGAILYVQINVNLVSIDIRELAESICASVDHRVLKVPRPNKVPRLVLDVPPVYAIEMLPLWRSFVKEECGILPVEDKGSKCP